MLSLHPPILTEPSKPVVVIVGLVEDDGDVVGRIRTYMSDNFRLIFTTQV